MKLIHLTIILLAMSAQAQAQEADTDLPSPWTNEWVAFVGGKLIDPICANPTAQHDCALASTRIRAFMLGVAQVWPMQPEYLADYDNSYVPKANCAAATLRVYEDDNSWLALAITLAKDAERVDGTFSATLVFHLIAECG